MQSFSKKQRETSEKGLKKTKQWLCCFRKEGKGNATGRPSGDCTLKKKLQCIEVVEELKKDVKERKVTIRVEKLKVRSCEVKELKRREVMNNKRDTKWLQSGAFTHTHTHRKARSRSGNWQSKKQDI